VVNVDSDLHTLHEEMLLYFEYCFISKGLNKNIHFSFLSLFYAYLSYYVVDLLEITVSF